ncbi:MAG: hypothetical protein KTR32_17440, partial [Granulosicoccus sp.]|nr:hypothetical protein [Granulosicoccus sp.]
MKLRSQMLVAAGLMLIVPIVGWQSTQELYQALQQTRIDEQTLKVANMRLALTDTPELFDVLNDTTADARAHDIYAEYSPYPLFLDGYADDWRPLHARAVSYANQSSPHEAISVRAAQRNDALFLHISVVDEQIVYHKIPVFRPDAGEGEQPDRWTQLVNGDSIEILIENNATGGGKSTIEHGLFRAIAPGPLTALQASDSVVPSGSSVGRKAGSPLSSWQAFWEESAGGYQLELQLPLPQSGSLIGIAVIDIDQRKQPRDRWSGSISPTLMARWNGEGLAPIEPARIFYNSERVESRLDKWVSPGLRARLFDRQGRLVADVNRLYTRADMDEESADEAAFSTRGILDALMLRLFSAFVAGDLPLMSATQSAPIELSLLPHRRALIQSGNEPVTSRYVTDENDRVLGSLASIGNDPIRAYLLLEANEEHSSAYAGSQLARLFGLLLLVSLLSGIGLLVFAMVLSARIRRLSQQAQHAVSVDGRVQGLPGSDARDEIGDLSRKLSSLLSRSAAYTSYLEALSGRLSHELRTPLSVVRTSIENLDLDRLDNESRTLVERANAGAAQLTATIKALVDSTRLEQIVQGAHKQSIDLADWLTNSQQTYAQV